MILRLKFNHHFLCNPNYTLQNCHYHGNFNLAYLQRRNEVIIVVQFNITNTLSKLCVKYIWVSGDYGAEKQWNMAAQFYTYNVVSI